MRRLDVILLAAFAGVATVLVWRFVDLSALPLRAASIAALTASASTLVLGARLPNENRP